jgi:hypothetical protein
MPLAIFYVSAAIWAFLCVLVAIVAGAAAGSRTSHWKRALVGALVGAMFGIITSALVSFFGTVTFFLISVLSASFDRFALYIAGILLSVAAAALAGLAVGLLERRSAAVVRRCVIVGIAFGLVLGIANVVGLHVWGHALIPALEAVGFGPLSPVSIGAATMASGVMVDLVLTIIAVLTVKSAISRTFRARLG